MYRIDTVTGDKTNLGQVSAPSHGGWDFSSSWTFVDRRGDVWFSIKNQGGDLQQIHGDTGVIEVHPNALPALVRWDSNELETDPARQANRSIAWMQPLDGDRALLTMSEHGGMLYEFDSTQPMASAFKPIKHIGYNYLGGLAIGGNRVFYYQRANRAFGNQESQDFHLLSVSLDEATGYPITDHGLIVDQDGRKVWRLPGMMADGQGHVYMIGDWWTIAGDLGTLRYNWNRGNEIYEQLPRGEFFAVANANFDSPETIQFNATSYSVAENGGTATITVTRTGAGIVSVDYATSNNTAAAGSDYIATSGRLNFAAGEGSKTFTIPITNDTTPEGNESLNLTLSSPSGAVIGHNGRAVLVISDDDVYTPPTLNFSAVNFAVPESTSTKTITVSRTGDSAGTVSVNWSVASNTATLGSDFTGPGGVLTFGPGVTSQSFTVNITNDTEAEGNETGHLILSNPTGGAKLGVRSRAMLTISDNDVSSSGFKFSNSVYTASESGSKPITISRTSSTTAQSVTFTTSNNGTALAGTDYTAVTSTVSFGINETSKTVNIPILADTIVESNESINLTLSNPTGGGTLGAQRTSVLFITDNDSNGTLQFKFATFTVSESGPTATIVVTRTGGTYGAISVSYSTSNNTATSGSDYTNTTGILNFAQGQSSKSFTIPIQNDSSVEGAESLNLTLSNPTGGATLGTIKRAILTITDND